MCSDIYKICSYHLNIKRHERNFAAELIKNTMIRYDQSVNKNVMKTIRRHIHNVESHRFSGSCSLQFSGL